MTKLKKVIEARGIKQVWLAEQIGVDQSVISRYVSGQWNMPKEHIKELARVLGVARGRRGSAARGEAAAAGPLF